MFLEKCQLSKLITKYIVLNESEQMLMALRPYQYFAVEQIVDHVRNTEKNGYIWHTTGSGKTLTSFKAAQILTQSPQVKKVVFVVDRKDLGFQTIREFNSFSEGSVDATNNTKRQEAQEKLSKEENLDPEGLEKVIGNYLFTEKPPMSDEVIAILKERPRLKERKTLTQRIIQKIKEFVETYIDGVD